MFVKIPCECIFFARPHNFRTKSVLNDMQRQGVISDSARMPEGRGAVGGGGGGGGAGAGGGGAYPSLFSRISLSI
jgi:hypothetical protein